MKAVFPCKGVVVLTKKDIQSLEAFYQSTLDTSKMAEIYNNTEFMVQIGNLNYLPPEATIIINEENLLTAHQLRSIMNSSTISKPQTKTSKPLENVESTLSDDDILSHPFFTTLKPID